MTHAPAPTTTTTIPAPIPIQRFSLLDSTSLHARRFVNSGVATAPILFIADEQTGGVGRFARPWASPRGGLWCTLLWPLPSSLSLRAVSKREGPGESSSPPASSAAPTSVSASFPSSAAAPAPPTILDGLGLRLGVACLNTVRAALTHDGAVPPHLDVRLKWPNDILVNSKKVLGVLCEIVPTPPPHTPHTFALVGVGLNANLNVDDLPAPLRRGAATLRTLTGRDADLHAIATDLAARVAAALSTPPTRTLDAATLAAARSALARVGETVRVTLPDRSTVEGTLTGLSDDGCPVLSTAAGVITLASGSDVL